MRFEQIGFGGMSPTLSFQRRMSNQYISVKVQPKAKKVGVEKITENTYKVRVLAAPEKGAANREVIAALAEHFHIPPSRITIVRGKTSRNKIISIDKS